MQAPFFILLIALTVLYFGSTIEAMSSPTDSSHYQEQSTKFMLDLMSKLYQSGKNLVLSPYSLASALVMLFPGTDGNSRAQLVKALFDANSKETTNADKYVQLFSDANNANLKKNEATLKVANMLYSAKRYG